MRRNARVVLAAASVSALVLVISLITVSSAATVTRIHVIEHATTDVVIDTDGDGADSTGDLLTFHNELFDADNVAVVGTDQGDCIRIEAGVSWECRFVNFLEGGSITVEGPFLDAGPSTFAITGGTGVFRNVGGTMRLISNADGTEFDFIFRVVS